ncbi:MAG TPA: helix-hairpin-helix domain-containing protein [Methylomirabilota bacterium]|nr:helix-hairpin-helix domain-containing protein [Methylomirabilota bacterium]
MLYSRPQLRLLLALGVILLVGLVVGEWRAGFPDAAERIERFDREEPPLLPTPVPPAAPKPLKSPTPAPPVAAPTPASAPAEVKPVDLNRATADELARLPGVGPGLARRIVEERERRGRFESPEALREVLGLGPKKLTALRRLVTIGD